MIQPLHNLAPPAYELVREKPEHRIMILLKAQGLSNVEIASATGYTTVAVGQIVRQEWFQKRLLEIIHAKGEAEVEKLMQQMAPKLLLMAQDLAENGKSEAVRSNTILGLLKVVKGEKQNIQMKPEGLDEIRSRRSQIEQQLKEIRGEGGAPSNGEEKGEDVETSAI